MQKEIEVQTDMYIVIILKLSPPGLDRYIMWRAIRTLWQNAL